MATNVRKRSILASIAFFLLSFLLFTAKKAFDYSAAPSGPKDCDFIFPRLNDDSKPTTITVPNDLVFEERGGYVNDASCLNKTPIYGIIKIKNVEQIREALKFARDNHLTVSIAGQRHSMGGQTFTPNGIVLDMRDFNQLRLDAPSNTLNAQTGATWQQIQFFLDPQGSAVKAR